MNWIGFWTLYKKEVDRTHRVIFQTILSPTLTTALYFLVFGTAIGSRIGQVENVPYSEFIVPGLIMMALITNSLTAASSGIYFPRFIGTITDYLSAPMGFFEIIFGYALASTTRALQIAALIYITALLFTDISIAHPFYTLLFAFLSALSFSLLGLILGIWAKSFEQLSFFPTIVLTPLSFLGGIFYSITMLPEFWQKVTLVNPIFYMISGLRYGFFGASDVDPMISLLFILGLLGICLVTLHHFFKTGYGIKT